MCDLYVADDSDDGEPVWVISLSLGCSVRSENCEVLHLNSNMVAASLKQSGLITDRAYNRLTANEDTLTRNALKFLWLAVQRSRGSYNSFLEAAQALCCRAMKASGDTMEKTNGDKTKPSHPLHTDNKSEQNNKTGKTGKHQRQQASDEEDGENLEKLNFGNGDSEKDFLLSLQGLMCFCSVYLYNIVSHRALCLLLLSYHIISYRIISHCSP